MSSFCQRLEKDPLGANWFRMFWKQPRNHQGSRLQWIRTRWNTSVTFYSDVLCFYITMDCGSRKKPLLQNGHFKAQLRFAAAHVDKPSAFWRKVLWPDERKIFGEAVKT